MKTRISGTLIHQPCTPYIVTFELGLPFDHGMMSCKVRDDISNGSGVIVLTNKQINKVTNRHC